MRRGAIILCGGQSTRMGRDKATLPFGPEMMLQRVVRLMGEVVEPANLAVVAAAGQSVPALPCGVIVSRDKRQARGPLEGLASGFDALRDRVDAVYATGCDVPLLVPAFVDRMFNLLGDYDIVVPRDHHFYHPLAAVYRSDLRDKIGALLSADCLRPRSLFDKVRTREVPVDDLRAVDPELLTLRNLNSPEDYSSALMAAGLSASLNL